MSTLTCRFDRVLRDGGKAILMLATDSYQLKGVELNPDTLYSVSITEAKSKRSLRQNALMWELIGKIAKATGQEDEKVYTDVVKMARIRTEFLETIPEALERLSRVFRFVVERDRRTSPKGTETVVVECYYGTSQYDTKEMSEFIDRLMDYAVESGVDVSGYDL